MAFLSVIAFFNDGPERGKIFTSTELISYGETFSAKKCLCCSLFGGLVVGIGLILEELKNNNLYLNTLHNSFVSREIERKPVGGSYMYSCLLRHSIGSFPSGRRPFLSHRTVITR